MKNGFSTLNRLLGKKNKYNNNLSKSTTNLNGSTSTTNIEDSSQMHQNRITPLPIATSNAPFEQTFRITVLLPKDQLYVARLGARVLLEKLLELVCENKQLDADKYEFRHPADPSQVFSCDLTIGAVGLSEIRLCHKSESYDTFNADEIIKLHRTIVGRDSMSSSEFSSRNSKQTLKTPSPYSSSNSLNSMDSTGINSTYRHSTPKLFSQQSQPPVAPSRKKRLAPRPPSQNSIPEVAASRPVAQIENPPSLERTTFPKENNLQTIPRKEFHVSSPNLHQTHESNNILNRSEFHKSNISIDCNGNTKSSLDNNRNALEINGHYNEEIGRSNSQRPMSLHVFKLEETTITSENYDEKAEERISRNSFNGIEEVSTNTSRLPEPSPRKKITKSKKSAPAPPPRVLQSTTETIEEHSQMPKDRIPITTLELQPPVALPRSSSGRITPDPKESLITAQNVSKTMLNGSLDNSKNVQEGTEDATTTLDDSFDTQSKQADSGIGEPLHPSPMPSSSPTQCKSPIESSSDDDELIKVYNLKLGKTILKTLSDHKALEDITILSTDDSEATDQAQTPAESCSIKSEATSWSNFTIPAPPNFADNSGIISLSDAPITPIIKERPALDFTTLKLENTQTSPKTSPEPSTEIVTEEKKLSNSDIEDGLNGQKAGYHIKNIITEDKSNKINDKFSETVVGSTDVIKNSSELDEESELAKIADENVLVNTQKPTISEINEMGEEEAKVINEMDTIINNIETIIKQKPLISTLDRLGVTDENEEDSKDTKIYKKRSSINLNNNILKHRRSITRSDSFHSTRQQQEDETIDPRENCLATRSSSFLSLAKFGLENQQSSQTEEMLGRRRSSSELSIGESPSLRSVEVMKSILNSRKNSLTSQSSSEESKPPSIVSNPVDQRESLPPKTNILRTQISKTKEEKVYRYSGPPSINFSTWSERPKVQVAIKNEGDYIFGGNNGGHNATTTATVNLVQQRKIHNSVTDTPNRLPFVRSVEYKKSSSAMSPLQELNARYSNTKEQTSAPTTPQSPPSTLPKPRFILGSRLSHPTPVVKGFVQQTSPDQSSSTNSLIKSNGSIHTSLLRSTSINQVDSKPKVEVEKTQTIFGQSTLRKTGLKDKILANEDSQPPKSTIKAPENIKIELKITKNQTLSEVNNSAEHSSVDTAPKAPPPPPIIRAVVTKQSSLSSIPVEPRDQLLAAIRGFKRNELKRI